MNTSSSNQLLLAIDIGNSNIVLGLFQGKTLQHQWRLASVLRKTADEYGAEISNLFAHQSVSPHQVAHTLCSSVVPPLTATVRETIQKTFRKTLYLVTPERLPFLTLNVDQPREVGADRLVNAVAAYRQYGGPCIIVDFGTATTFCAVSAQGEYLGGAITAGPKIIRDALYQRTAQLPKVELVRPEHPIGHNTVHALQAGFYYGTLAMVTGVIAQYRRALGLHAKVIATGGLAHLFDETDHPFDIVNPSLTLEGLQMIWEASQGTAPNAIMPTA